MDKLDGKTKQGLPDTNEVKPLSPISTRPAGMGSYNYCPSFRTTGLESQLQRDYKAPTCNDFKQYTSSLQHPVPRMPNSETVG